MSKVGRSRGRSVGKALREKQERKRQRMWIAGGVVAVVLGIVLTMVVVKLVGDRGNGDASGNSSSLASNSLVSTLTTIPESNFNQVGSGGLKQGPSKTSVTTAHTIAGKAAVLYVGAEYCPYCAAQRWGLIVALSRFGTISKLKLAQSSAQDVYPKTQTFSFHDSSFSSDYVSFTGVEESRNQKLTSEQRTLFETYNRPPYVDTSGSIPFLDVANMFIYSGASFRPALLAGKTREQIAQSLRDPNSDVAQAIIGTANLITASICVATGDNPSQVCTSSGVSAAKKLLT